MSGASVGSGHKLMEQEQCRADQKISLPWSGVTELHNKYFKPLIGDHVRTIQGLRWVGKIQPMGQNQSPN